MFITAVMWYDREYVTCVLYAYRLYAYYAYRSMPTVLPSVLSQYVSQCSPPAFFARPRNRFCLSSVRNPTTSPPPPHRYVDPVSGPKFTLFYIDPIHGISIRIRDLTYQLVWILLIKLLLEQSHFLMHTSQYYRVHTTMQYAYDLVCQGIPINNITTSQY